ncbi:MAG: hypothetical protein KAR21_04130 [Spirochaetales bacterium]|nr:hypothetical protein [Spirochaetales bacterium]
MKRILFILLPLILIVFIGLFVSCDFLLPAPLGRNNPYDDEAQIGRFNCAVAGLDSIITAWDWRGPIPGIDDSRIIDKIRIVHSRNDPPQSKYPLNPDNVIELDSNSTWQHEWDGLKADREHHFALYAHEKGGIWLAPKRISQHLDNNGHEERWNISFERFGVNTSAGTNTVQIADLQVTDVPPPKIGFIRFDELYYNEYGIVLDARIYLDAVGSAGDIFVVPLRIRIEEGMEWNQISDSGFYNYGNALLVNIAGAPQYIGIKDQINIARLHGSNTLAIIPDSASAVDINLGDFDFWDTTDDTFSVWRNN